MLCGALRGFKNILRPIYTSYGVSNENPAKVMQITNPRIQTETRELVKSTNGCAICIGICENYKHDEFEQKATNAKTL